jgi:outer membrane protein
MNKLSLILNIVLLIAVAVLYYLHFNQSNSGANYSLPSNLSGQPVLYLNTDSLLTKYQLFQESKAQLEQEQARLEGSMQSQAANLEREVMEFQQQYGGMTQSQVDKRKEELGRKEENLMMLREQLAGQLMEQESKLNKQIYDSIYNFLQRYTAGKNVQYILGYSPGGSVLYANDSLDITAQVVEGLNLELKK